MAARKSNALQLHQQDDLRPDSQSTTECTTSTSRLRVVVTKLYASIHESYPSTTCKSIIVPTLMPTTLAFPDATPLERGTKISGEYDINDNANVVATTKDELAIIITTTPTTSSPSPMDCANNVVAGRTQTLPHFPFLKLPAELRMKIYRFLLDPQPSVQMFTQLPYNGNYFYSTPAHSTRSMYIPTEGYGYTRKKPRIQRGYLTTYAFEPHDRFLDGTCISIRKPSEKEEDIVCHTAILCTCIQIRSEGEAVLYANTTFDFGWHTGAVGAFMKDRGIHARMMIRRLRVKVDTRIPYDEDEEEECWGTGWISSHRHNLPATIPVAANCYKECYKECVQVAIRKLRRIVADCGWGKETGDLDDFGSGHCQRVNDQEVNRLLEVQLFYNGSRTGHRGP